MIRLDSHNHFWTFDPVRDDWIDDSMEVLRQDFLPEDIYPHLRNHGFDGTIAVQADQSEEETRFLLHQAESFDFVKGVVGWIDFQSEDIEAKLASYASTSNEKLRGFRHIAQSEPDDWFLVREAFVHGLSRLHQFGFTFDILIYQHQLSAAIELVRQLPDQAFVLDHMAKPLIKSGKMEPWVSQIRSLASARNVFCKVSGIITEADHAHWSKDDIRPYLDVVFEAFGVDRVMFGSDWPVCLLAGSYDRVYHLIEDSVQDLGEGTAEKVFGGNAARFYGID
jgi:L-fuconolactonase